MATSRYYTSLSTPAPQPRSGSRRPPLTPSTVSSPLLTTGVPVTSRRDSGSSPTRASTLLAKVVSHPTTPKESPATSPIATPGNRPADLHSSPLYTPERPSVWRSESARYVRQYRHQDGYISFPDFEKFCQTQSPYETQQTAVKT